AKYQQHGVVRNVVGTKECLHIGQAGRIEVGKIAIKIVRVGPVPKGDGRHVEPREASVGLVHDIDSDFFFDHVALVAQIFVVDLEGAHGVSFQPQNTLERVGGHSLVIVRHIVHGGAVQDAAARIDQLDVLHFGGILGALKHHVFEQVRESAAAL